MNFYKSFYLIVLFFVCSTIYGCNSLPSDLQERKNDINNLYKELKEKELSASRKNDYDELIQNYTSLRNQIVSYTDDANSRGYDKNNDKIIGEIDRKLSEFKNLASSLSNNDFHICSICGRPFKGNGYEEVSEGVWQPCHEPYQCQICSVECGITHTRKMNGLIDSITRL